MRKVAGWFLIFFGLAGFGAEIDNLRKGTADNTVLGFILASLFLFGGLALIRRPRQGATPAMPPAEALLPVEQAPALSSRDVERAVLTCAKEHGGRVTIAEVAAETDLTFTESKAVLERLQREGACTVDVTEQGAFIYEFSGLMPRKREAADV